MNLEITGKPIFRILLVFVVIYLPFGGVHAQYQEDSINSTRLRTVLVTAGVTYSASLLALNNLWYSNHPKEKFHFFDDSGEWLQMDKAGHVFSAFQFSQAGAKSFQWAGIGGKKSVLLGSALGAIFMLPIEIMDGYSSEYGASGSDLFANFLGVGFYIGQDLIWGETRIHPKFSFSNSDIAYLRPELLGKNQREQIFKDYNGQTYWLSFDIYSFTGLKPKWLNLAVGYGVENMINASGNPTLEFPNMAYRQYYLGIDLDLSHFRTSSKVVNTLLYVANLIHLPSPALEFNNQKQLIFHPLHF